VFPFVGNAFKRPDWEANCSPTISRGHSARVVGSSSPLSANGRTRPAASSMLINGGKAALIFSIARRSGRSTYLFPGSPKRVTRLD
jgi:hypothetical protein